MAKSFLSQIGQLGGGDNGFHSPQPETGSSILRGLGELSPTFLKVAVIGLVIWVTHF